MKKIILSVLSILVFFILLLGGGMVFINKIYQKQMSLIEIQQKIKKTEARKQNLKDFEALFTRVQERKDDIENIFVDERSVVRVIEALEEHARLLGVDFKVESASLPTTTVTRGPEIQLHLEGSFAAIYQYIRVLEVLPFQFTFNLIDIRKNSPDAVWSATIRLTVLSFMPNL